MRPGVLLRHIALTLILAAALATSIPAFAHSSAHLRSLKEIREQGVVMQQWENSCAAAALATVFTHHLGLSVSERQAAAGMLRQTDAARVRARGGFSLLDMKRFVEQLGYRAGAYKNLSLEDLEAFRAPIVPISVAGYHHYVVVNEVGDSAVQIADPAFGIRSLRRDKFARIWTDGLAFAITPAAETTS